MTAPELDVGAENREMARERGKLEVLNRAQAIVCAPAATGNLRLATYLALNTSLPVPECLALLATMGAPMRGTQSGLRELREALAGDLARAAELLRFRDASPEPAAGDVR
jgi:hypothetical protein